MLKRFTCLMILIIFFLNLIFPILSIATDEIVTIKFEDEKLYNAIVEKIGKKIANNDDSTYTIQIIVQPKTKKTMVRMKKKRIILKRIHNLHESKRSDINGQVFWYRRCKRRGKQ